MVSKKKSFQAIRGMKDILAKDWLYYDYILSNTKKIFEFHGFERIETPILEKADLFSKGIGEDTDIIGKEMYVLRTKENEELLALRPEGTASVVRAYIEKGMANLSQPVKLYYFGLFFRHEKPQYGRYRQFYQLGAEMIGEFSSASDVEILIASKVFLESLGFKQKDICLSLNSIGCSKCRPVYIRELKKYYKQYSTQICADCRRRIKENPLRVLDCKNEKCSSIKDGAPIFLDYLCPECHNHFKSVLELLDYLGIYYTLDKTLVRGFDYYTKTVFEFSLGNEEKGIALAGGGRYDKLVELLGGTCKPAVGVAFGVERLINQIVKNGKELIVPKPKIFLVQIGDAAKKQSFKLLEQFRKENIFLGENLGKESLRAQLAAANKLNVDYVLMLGQEEVLNGMIILKDMNSGLQELIPLEKITDEVKKRLKKQKSKSK